MTVSAGTLGDLTLISGGTMTLGGLTGQNVTATAADRFFNSGFIDLLHTGDATFYGDFTQVEPGSMSVGLGGRSTAAFSTYTFLATSRSEAHWRSPSRRGFCRVRETCSTSSTGQAS